VNVFLLVLSAALLPSVDVRPDTVLRVGLASAATTLQRTTVNFIGAWKGKGYGEDVDTGSSPQPEHLYRP
jgi:hypothetical protein